MGQTWSKFMSGHMEAGINPPEPEMDICTSPDPNLQESEASTEASSSVPFYQGGPFSVAAADVELSSLKDDESDEERGKETETTPTPTPSTSQQPSSLHAFLKGSEKVHLKKSQQASPSTAAGSRAPLKTFSRKSRPCKQPRISSPPRLLQHHTSRKFDAEPAKRYRAQQEESSTSSPSQFSPSQPPGAKAQVNEEEEAPSHEEPEEDDVKVESAKEGENLVHASAQKLLLFQLDRKRKAPTGLPSLAVECMGASRMKLKARTSPEKTRGNSEGWSRKAPLDLGEAVVSRRVRKTIGSRSTVEGHVASYDVSSRLYQIEYDNGRQEEMEWPDLEPCLIDQSKTASAPVGEIKGTTTVLRKSLRNAPRVKKVEEFVYTTSKVRSRRQKK